MADERLRDAERRFNKTRALEDEGVYLLERARAGELELKDLQVAATLGDPASRMALTEDDVPEALPELGGKVSFNSWRVRLGLALGFEYEVRALVAAFRDGVQLLEDGSDKRYVIELLLRIVERYFLKIEEERDELFDLMANIHRRLEGLIGRVDERHENSRFLYLPEAAVRLIFALGSYHDHDTPEELTGLRMELNSVYSDISRSFSDPLLPSPLTKEEADQALFESVRDQLLDDALKRGPSRSSASMEDLRVAVRGLAARLQIWDSALDASEDETEDLTDFLQQVRDELGLGDQE